VVVSDIPPRAVVVGVPARYIGTIDEKMEKYLSKRGLFLWKFYEKPRLLTEDDITRIKKRL